MEIYNSEIAANPKAYDIYFRRAGEYYRYNQYLRALTDVEKAIEYAPSGDADFRHQAFMLKGEILQMLDRKVDALEAFTEAVRIEPSSYQGIHQKANCEYELGQYQEAKADYTRLRGIDPRSPEAMTGLARVAIKEHNLGLAQEYMDDAVAMMPNDSDIYVRRSSIRRELGNPTGAAQDLLMAISLDNSPKAFERLVSLSNSDYPAVNSALTDAIRQAPEQGMFRYIRAAIAQNHRHYPLAVEDYNALIDQNIYNYAGIYASLAECEYALADYDSAIQDVNRAIAMDPANADYQLVLSKVLRALGRNADALKAAEAGASSTDPNAAIILALANEANGDATAADGIYAEMIMDNPDRQLPYLLRAWLLSEKLNRQADARAVANRLLNLGEGDSSDAPEQNLKGFAYLLTMQPDEAKRSAEALLNKQDSDGSLAFIAACILARTDSPEIAIDALKRSINRGFADRRLLSDQSDAAPFNLAPLYKNQQLKAQVEELLAANQSLFSRD